MRPVVGGRDLVRIHSDSEQQVATRAHGSVTGAYLFIKLETQGSREYSEVLFRTFEAVTHAYIVAGHFNLIARVAFEKGTPDERIDRIGEIVAAIESQEWAVGTEHRPPPREVLVYYCEDAPGAAPLEVEELLADREGAQADGKAVPLDFLVEMTVGREDQVADLAAEPPPGLAVLTRILNRNRVLAHARGPSTPVVWDSLRAAQSSHPFPWTRSHLLLAMRKRGPEHAAPRSGAPSFASASPFAGAWLLIRLRQPGLTAFARHLLARHEGWIRCVLVTAGEVDVIAYVEAETVAEVGRLLARVQISPWALAPGAEAREPPPHSVELLYLSKWRWAPGVNLRTHDVVALTTVTAAEPMPYVPKAWLDHFEAMMGNAGETGGPETGGGRDRKGGVLVGFGVVHSRVPRMLAVFGAKEARSVWTKVEDLREAAPRGKATALRPPCWTHSHVSFRGVVTADLRERFLQERIFALLRQEPAGLTQDQIADRLSEPAKTVVGPAVNKALDAGWCVRAAPRPRIALAADLHDRVRAEMVRLNHPVYVEEVAPGVRMPVGVTGLVLEEMEKAGAVARIEGGARDKFLVAQ